MKQTKTHEFSFHNLLGTGILMITRYKGDEDKNKTTFRDRYIYYLIEIDNSFEITVRNTIE